MILLPHHFEFTETLANLRFFHKGMVGETCEVMHMIQKNPNYLPETVTTGGLQEYLLGGEADQCVEFVDGYADSNVGDVEEEGEAGNYFLPEWELGDEWIGSI